MRKLKKFLFIEITIFLFMLLITIIEKTDFRIFRDIFTFIQSPFSWFIGISLAYAFSNALQIGLFTLFSRKTKQEGKEKGDFFAGFLVTLIITSLTTPYIYKWAEYFFTEFFVYFHVIALQSIILIYFLFKMRGHYRVSWIYLLTTEAITVFFWLMIKSFVS